MGHQSSFAMSDRCRSSDLISKAWHNDLNSKWCKCIKNEDWRDASVHYLYLDNSPCLDHRSHTRSYESIIVASENSHICKLMTRYVSNLKCNDPMANIDGRYLSNYQSILEDWKNQRCLPSLDIFQCQESWFIYLPQQPSNTSTSKHLSKQLR